MLLAFFHCAFINDVSPAPDLAAPSDVLRRLAFGRFAHLFNDLKEIVMRHIFLTFFWSVVTLISLYISTLAGPMFPVTS